MADLGFLGMRAAGEWPDNVQPENFRQGILLYYPNGRAPLTAIMSAIRTEVTDDTTIHWFSKTLATQRATLQDGGVYDDAALTTAYSGADGTDGTVVYCKLKAAAAKHFNKGKTVLLRESTDYSSDTHGKVVDIKLDGDDSYLAVMLREDDPNDLAGVDTVMIIGNSHAQGGPAPDAIGYDVEEQTNITQIFKNTLDLSGTTMSVRYRTGDALAEAKRETLELHGIELEKSHLWSLLYKDTGDNSKALWEMDGLISIITTNAPNNIFDYKTDTEFSGQAWDVGGEEWLDKLVYQLFDYGDDSEKLGLCGRAALRAINRLAKLNGFMSLEPMTTKFGMKVVRWVTAVGDIFLKTHPLYTYNPTDLNTIVILEPKLLTSRPLRMRDTHYQRDVLYDAAGYTTIDGKKEQWLTETTMEYQNPLAMGVAYNVGKDNTLSP